MAGGKKEKGRSAGILVHEGREKCLDRIGNQGPQSTNGEVIDQQKKADKFGLKEPIKLKGRHSRKREGKRTGRIWKVVTLHSPREEEVNTNRTTGKKIQPDERSEMIMNRKGS